jgi:hypothetical protein
MNALGNALLKLFSVFMLASSHITIVAVALWILEKDFDREQLRLMLLGAIPAASSGVIGMRGQAAWALALGFWSVVFAFSLIAPQIH